MIRGCTMERNIFDAQKQYYLDNTIFREINPIFKWKKCEKCRKEFKKEKMYYVTFYDGLYCNYKIGVYGCHHCFSNIESFQKYIFDLISKRININESEYKDGIKIKGRIK